MVLQDVYGAIKDRIASPELTVTLMTDPALWEAGRMNPKSSHEYIFEKSASALPMPPTGACYRRYAWARQNRGIDAGGSEFRLVLQSSSDKPILLESVSVKIERRGPGVKGLRVACPVGGATANLRRLAVDLDAGRAGLQDGERNPLPSSMLKFSQGETEAIAVIADILDSRVDWSLRLNLIVDGHRTTVRVPEGRGTFSTTGIENGQMVHPSRGRWKDGMGPMMAGILTP